MRRPTPSSRVRRCTAPPDSREGLQLCPGLVELQIAAFVLVHKEQAALSVRIGFPQLDAGAATPGELPQQQLLDGHPVPIHDHVLARACIPAIDEQLVGLGKRLVHHVVDERHIVVVYPA